MMGAIVRLGQGDLSLEDIKNSLNETVEAREILIVPSSGLILNKVEFL